MLFAAAFFAPLAAACVFDDATTPTPLPRSSTGDVVDEPTAAAGKAGNATGGRTAVGGRAGGENVAGGGAKPSGSGGASGPAPGGAGSGGTNGGGGMGGTAGAPPFGGTSGSSAASGAGGNGGASGAAGVSGCPFPLADCDGNGTCESDLATAHDHCGVCAHACAGPSTCASGQCTPVVVSFLSAHPAAACNGKGVTADFDGDGDFDVLVACTKGGFDFVPGRGDGTFDASIHGATTVAVDWPVVVDLDGDGALDVVGTEQSPPAVAVLRNGGGGAFSFASVPSEPDVGNDLETGDYDGDGHPDVAWTTSSLSGTKIWVSFGQGDGSLSAPTQIPAPTGSYVVAAGDFDGDGRDDLVFLDDDLELGVLRNVATTPTTTWVIEPSTEGWTIFVADDADDNGTLDIVRVMTGTSDTTASTDWTAFVYEGDGKGAFGARQQRALTPSPRLAARKIADLDQDGRADVVVSGDYHTAFGRGDGSFVYGSGYSLTGAPALPLRDFDGDGIVDVIAVTGDGIVFLPGKPVSPPVAPPAYPMSDALVADLDGDHRLDLTGSDDAALALGLGDGSFVPALTLPFAPRVLADVDGDGSLDLIGPDRIARNDGTGHFFPPVVQQLTDIRASGDFDGDGRADGVSWTPKYASTAEITIGRGRADGSFDAGESYPLSPAADTISVVDANADGRSDIFVGDRLLLAGATGALSAPIALGFTATRLVDIDGDGAVDAVLGASSTKPGDCPYEDCSITVRRNLGALAFAPAIDSGLPKGILRDLADFDADGKLDALVAEAGGVASDDWYHPRDAIHIGHGDGTFEATPAFATSQDCTWTGRDLDGDGLLDLVGQCGADLVAIARIVP